MCLFYEVEVFIFDLLVVLDLKNSQLRLAIRQSNKKTSSRLISNKNVKASPNPNTPMQQQFE